MMIPIGNNRWIETTHIEQIAFKDDEYKISMLSGDSFNMSIRDFLMRKTFFLGNHINQEILSA